MGDRYIITVKCPTCEHVDNDVYFAPTCGFTNWKCPKCKCLVDLYEETGMTYEDCSNAVVIKSICEKWEA